jgi:soluble lytic murein transglycosylase
MLAAARAARDFGFPDIAAGLASRLKTVPGASTPPRALLRLLYPVRYVALLNSETREQDVDPLVAAALIRQESFWDPMAHSPADAFGLTQVIPPTGEAIAEHFGIPNFSAADLYRPGLSLRFGVYYLGEQLRRYQSPTLAFAAYNAGPVNAERWSRATASAEAADIVEVIDIAETRDYVIRIFEHLAHYEAAYP